MYAQAATDSRFNPKPSLTPWPAGTDKDKEPLDNPANKIAHLQLPQMLYFVECLVFLSGFVLCALFLAGAPSPTLAQTYQNDSIRQSRVFYGITFVALASLIAAIVSGKTTMLFSSFIRENKYNSKFPGALHFDTGLHRQKADLEMEIDLARYAGAMTAGPFCILVLLDMFADGQADAIHSKGVCAPAF